MCDEPISALDVSIQAQVLNLLTDLREQLGLTYLFIAHDLSVVKHISDRVAVMYLGKIVEIGPPDIMYAAPGHPYTRALLSAVPVPDPVLERKRKRVILTGDVPSPVNPPEGCRFHTRCWLYERLGKPEQCRTIDPPILMLQGDHGAACHFAEQALASDVGVAPHRDEPGPARDAGGGAGDDPAGGRRCPVRGADRRRRRDRDRRTADHEHRRDRRVERGDGLADDAAGRPRPDAASLTTVPESGHDAAAPVSRRRSPRVADATLSGRPGPRKWHARQVAATDVLERRLVGRRRSPGRRASRAAGSADGSGSPTAD